MKERVKRRVMMNKKDQKKANHRVMRKMKVKKDKR